MSRNEQSTYVHALKELATVRDTSAPQNRLFQICANNARDWAQRPEASWYVQDQGSLTWGCPTERQQKFYEHLLILVNDFDALTSIVYRLEWFRNQQTSSLSADDLSIFLAADVHAFHVEFRSLMETLCHVINVASAKPGQVPTKSFQELRKWCIKNDRASKSILGPELSELIAQSYWFIEIRKFRDKIVHKQSDATVRIINGPNEVAFLTFRGRSLEPYEGPNAFMYNSWVYFRAHAGYYLGRLLYLLNAVCGMAKHELELSLVDIYWTTSRMPVIHGCIDYAIQSLESGFPLTESWRIKFPEKQPAPSASLHEKILVRAFFLSYKEGLEHKDQLWNWFAAESAQLRSYDED